MTLEELITKKLKQTLDCEFKRAVFPKGWTMVKINCFAKQLAEEINKLNKEEL